MSIKSVTVTYVSATDTVGSRYRVSCEGKRRLVSFDYAARDARVSAVARALGVEESAVAYVRSRSRDSHVYAVTV